MQPEQAERLAELVEHAFELEVALKLVRAGMDPAEIVARFRHEEQILASLNHPNIAQLKTRLSAPRESLRRLEQTRTSGALSRVVNIFRAGGTNQVGRALFKRSGRSTGVSPVGPIGAPPVASRNGRQDARPPHSQDGCATSRCRPPPDQRRSCCSFRAQWRYSCRAGVSG